MGKIFKGRLDLFSGEDVDWELVCCCFIGVEFADDETHALFGRIFRGILDGDGFSDNDKALNRELLLVFGVEDETQALFGKTFNGECLESSFSGVCFCCA